MIAPRDSDHFALGRAVLVSLALVMTVTRRARSPDVFHEKLELLKAATTR